MQRPLRDRVSDALEAALFLGVAGWLVYLITSFHHEPNWRDALELAALALLTWWPMIRTRIKGGWWP